MFKLYNSVGYQQEIVKTRSAHDLSTGGGMLVSEDEALITHARKLATQANDC
jgi:hypothetical protein